MKKQQLLRRGRATATVEVIDVLSAAARQDLLSFIQICFYVLSPSQPLKMNWHIKAIAYQLEEVLQGRRKRLIISIPPRHLKSIITSVIFPAYILVVRI